MISSVEDSFCLREVVGELSGALGIEVGSEIEVLSPIVELTNGILSTGLLFWFCRGCPWLSNGGLIEIGFDASLRMGYPSLP
jgi:hypothetical protein